MNASKIITGQNASIRKQEFQSNILIVDDRPENLLTLESVLENGKRKFFKAESGNEALKIALQEQLTLVMMDIQMPDMDGLETSRLLRLNPRTKDIPILFVSAINPKDKYPLDGFEPGTVDFLFKPLNLQDTKSKVAIFEKLWSGQQEIKQMKKNIERITKDFDSFTYMVSHDLKTPLRALTNLSAWIAEDLGETGNPNIKENLGLMKERAARMAMMIEGILEYARAGQLKESPQLTNVKQLIHSIFESIQPSGNFVLELTGEWLEVYTEKNKLEKILRQLMKNAILHHDKDKGLVQVNCSCKTNMLHFTVSDDGPGIKPVHYKTVFEMFQTLHPKDEVNTSGTGLAISKKIIEDQGGTIYIEANEPTGCKFIFTWPL